jgi:hypothetical protein
MKEFSIKENVSNETKKKEDDNNTPLYSKSWLHYTPSSGSR